MKYTAAVIVLISLVQFIHAKQPVVFYSDLTSGPSTGGKDDKGAWVTINGRNFGNEQGKSFVTIGGGKVDNYPHWSDTRIIFQLGPKALTGNIQVHTSSGTSVDGINFTIRPGNIYFVDVNAKSPGIGSFENPWNSPKSFFEAQSPGDTCYFREGVYTDNYGNNWSGRPYCVSYYNAGCGGAIGNEIAWVGYPDETAFFKADGDKVHSGSFELREGRDYIVIANLSHYGMGNAHDAVRIQGAKHIRFVNNRITGLPPGSMSYGVIGILAPAEDIKIYGNEIFEIRSGNKLDHAVYFQGGDDSSHISNVDIAWNVFYDIDLHTGPLFSWNMHPAGCTSVFIHHNVIDNRLSSRYLRLAGMWSLASGSNVFFYNNEVYEASAGSGDRGAFYIGGGTAYIFNNTFYDSYCENRNGAIICTYNDTGRETAGNAVVKNNIFHSKSSMKYAVNEGSGSLLLDSNCYAGDGYAPGSDRRGIRKDPKFIRHGTLRLHEKSPCIDSGTNSPDIMNMIRTDIEGNIRSGKVDIGAHEHTNIKPSRAHK